MSPSGFDRRLFWILGVALFISYAYFYQAGGWNQNSRFALVRGILEHHSLQIDAYHEETGDRAIWNGHYYSDKAPGASLVALIPVDVARAAGSVIGVSPESESGLTWSSYVATLTASALFTVMAALAVLWLSLRWGFSSRAALFAATAYAVASPAWCYATLFMGHGLSAGCLMLAFAAAVALDDASDQHARRLAWTVGLACGWAVVSDFPSAVPVVLIVGLALLTVRMRGTRALSHVAVPIVAGGAISALVLLGYNMAAFGSPFHLGYASEEGFEQLHTGLFGISRPEWWRVREILVGSYRGLWPMSPLMALAPIGLAVLARTARQIRPALVAAAIATFYLALNASYFYWEGGWIVGPRQLAPALPFLALGLAPLWDKWRSAGRVLLAACWTWGAALTLVAVSTTAQPPASVERPLTDLLLPAFREGALGLNNQRFTDFRADETAIRRHTPSGASWNLGMKVGLTGLASLVPLGFVWLGCGWWLSVVAAESKESSSTTRRGSSR